jgi:colanic acid biosynthesis glycosyl transferase WcaI
MKIVIYGINYSPEKTGIGRYTGQLAEFLNSQGHSVRVVTAYPYYPHWSLEAGTGRWYSTEWQRGIEIHRCPLYVPKHPNGLTRILHLLSFALASAPVIHQQYRWQPDLILTVAPSLFCAPIARRLARRTGAVAVLHVQDLELDAAQSLGLLGDAPGLQTWVRRWERRQLMGFDRVSTISEGMMRRLREKQVLPERLHLLPNWVDVNRIYPKRPPSPFRKELGIPDQARVCLYSGSMNRKQGLELLGSAARRLADDPTVHWVFCGQGPTRIELSQQCADLPQVHFLDLQPEERLNDLLNLADLHLLPQKAGVTDLVMPSKLLGMLASGRPVLATALPESDLYRLVSRCGLCTEPDNVEAFTRAVRLMLNDAGRCQALGAQARNLAVQEFSADAVLTRFDAMLQTQTPTAAGPASSVVPQLVRMT